MTASKLKRLYQRNNPKGHFFSRSNMRFLGDTMGNFYVMDCGVVTTYSGDSVPAWGLRRRSPVNGGLVGLCAYFSKEDESELHGERGRGGLDEEQ
jgi:hypothetical protein